MVKTLRLQFSKKSYICIMELSNNLTEIYTLVYTLLTRIDVLEARVREMEDKNKVLKDEFLIKYL